MGYAQILSISMTTPAPVERPTLVKTVKLRFLANRIHVKMERCVAIQSISAAIPVAVVLTSPGLIAKRTSLVLQIRARIMEFALI